MASYLASFIRRLVGPRNTFDETDFLDALRPRYALRTPHRLPNTPTITHLPPSRPQPKNASKKRSKQCPHCRKTFYLELSAGRISKPLRARRTTLKGGKRWVSVGDEYKVEDLSPRLAKRVSGGWANCDEARERRVEEGGWEGGEGARMQR